jgi:hypothetical protein
LSDHGVEHAFIALAKVRQERAGANVEEAATGVIHEIHALPRDDRR